MKKPDNMLFKFMFFSKLHNGYDTNFTIFLFFPNVHKKNIYFLPLTLHVFSLNVKSCRYELLYLTVADVVSIYAKCYWYSY